MALQQQFCRYCDQPLLHNRDIPILEKIKYKEAIMKAVGAKEDWEPKVSPPIKSVFTAATKFTRAESDAVILVRRGNDSQRNTLIAPYKKDNAEILNEIYEMDCALSTHKLFGEGVSFKQTVKIIVYALKCLSFGTLPGKSSTHASVTDLQPYSGDRYLHATLVWTKADMDKASPTLDWRSDDAHLRLQQHFSALTVVISKLLSEALAAEHHQLCTVLMAALAADQAEASCEWDAEEVFNIHKTALAWWRGAMLAYVSKAQFLEEAWGKDLLWSHQGTPAMRIKLFVRSKKLVGAHLRGFWAHFVHEHHISS